MKGVALAINTVIIMILAIVVLIVLSAIFLGVANPFQRDIQAQATVTRVCNAYLNFDTDCDGEEYNEYVGDGSNKALLEELGKACKTLRICSSSGAADYPCIQRCCPTCPKTTTTT